MTSDFAYQDLPLFSVDHLRAGSGLGTRLVGRFCTRFVHARLQRAKEKRMKSGVKITCRNWFGDEPEVAYEYDFDVENIIKFEASMQQVGSWPLLLLRR